MGICDKRTLQPGGVDPCDDGTNFPPGAEPPGGLPDVDRPFDPPPPPPAGSCNIDDDCPEGYICLDGKCVPDPRLPGGPNTPIIGCNIDEDCPPGWSCINGVCFPPTEPESPGGPTDPGNGPPFPDGPGGGGGGGCAGEFICLIEPPVPTLMINPVEEVEGGNTLGIQGEGPVYKVPLEICEILEEIEGPPLDPVRCSVDTDCPEGFICVDGLCVSAECEPACCDILEEGKDADEFCELREKEYDENEWEVTDREAEPKEQGYPYPFSGTLGKGKEFWDHSLNCQAQNGQELWNINDGLQHNSCFLPDKYAKVKWEPRQWVFCRRVDFCDNTQTWGDVFIGDLGQYQDGGVTPGCSEDRIPKDQQTSGRLFVQHSTTLYDSLSVKEWTYLNCTLDVEGETTINANLNVASDITCAGTLYVGEPQITVGGKTYKPRTIRVITSVDFESQTTTSAVLNILDAG